MPYRWEQQNQEGEDYTHANLVKAHELRAARAADPAHRSGDGWPPGAVAKATDFRRSTTGPTHVFSPSETDGLLICCSFCVRSS